MRAFINSRGVVLIHQIDEGSNRVLASTDRTAPSWCAISEQYFEVSEELEPGFTFGSEFVPLCETVPVVSSK